MKRLLVTVAAILGLASAYLKSSDVAPTHFGLSGVVSGDPQYGVAETFVANFDSAADVQFFVGDVGAFGNTYNVDIYDYPDGYIPIAYSYNVAAPAKGHVWLRFPMTTEVGKKFVRGREYIVRVARPGDSAA